MPAPPRRTLAIIACVKSGRKERFLNQTALSRTLLPSLAETLDMCSMPSTPLISCSIGVATVSPMVTALAPG